MLAAHSTRNENTNQEGILRFWIPVDMLSGNRITEDIPKDFGEKILNMNTNCLNIRVITKRVENERK